MKVNYKSVFPFAVTLQILIVLFAVMVIPAAAVPEMPLILQGSLEVDGAPAPVGTVVSVELNGEIVGTTTVDYEGVYGYYPANKLPVTCSTEDYANLVFLVDGTVSQLVDVKALENAGPGDILTSIDMVATSVSSGSDGGDNNDGGGGSSGSSGYYSTSTSDSETDDESQDGSTASASTTNNADDTSLKSVANTQPTESTGEGVPASETETGSSMMIILIGAIILIGIVVIVGYKLKEN